MGIWKEICFGLKNFICGCGCDGSSLYDMFVVILSPCVSFSLNFVNEYFFLIFLFFYRQPMSRIQT